MLTRTAQAVGRRLSRSRRTSSSSSSSQQPPSRLEELQQPLLEASDEPAQGTGAAAPATAQSTGAGTPEALTLHVGGMTCGHCVDDVRQALEAVPGVQAVSADLESGLIEVSGTAAPAALVGAVEATGRAASVQPAIAATTTTLRVGGMVCGHCVDDVRQTLEAVPGAADVSVELESGLVRVDGEASPEALIEAVQAGGRSASLVPVGAAAAAANAVPTTRWLAVHGMTCNGCSEKVARALRGVEGVASAEVDLEQQAARVEYLPSATSGGDDRLVKAVAASGRRYLAAIVDAGSINVSEFGGRRVAPTTAAGEMVVLAIEGMSCTACAAKIEGALGALGGVSSVSISLMANSGKVHYSAAEVGVPSLVETV
eukprot:5210721-Prymnesium_polylepis.1